MDSRITLAQQMDLLAFKTKTNGLLIKKWKEVEFPDRLQLGPLQTSLKMD